MGPGLSVESCKREYFVRSRHLSRHRTNAPTERPQPLQQHFLTFSSRFEPQAGAQAGIHGDLPNNHFRKLLSLSGGLLRLIDPLCPRPARDRPSPHAFGTIYTVS